MSRQEILNDLIAFRKPINVLADNLAGFDWDYDGKPLIITVYDIQDILKRFLQGSFNAQDLEDWANLIECREDLEFEKSKFDVIENVIDCLANPSLQGEITLKSCEELLNTL